MKAAKELRIPVSDPPFNMREFLTAFGWDVKNRPTNGPDTFLKSRFSYQGAVLAYDNAFRSCMRELYQWLNGP